MDTKNTQRGRGRPSVDTERVCARIERETLLAMDEFSKAEADNPSRSEVVRRVLRLWFSERGLLGD